MWNRARLDPSVRGAQRGKIAMIRDLSKLVAARAVLEKAEEDLGDPGKLDDIRNVINSLLQGLSGVSPQIEKDIAKKLVLTYRNKVLSEVKLMLSNVDSYEAAFLEYWNEVMGVFVDARLADDPEFNACKEQLVRRRASRSVDGLKAREVDMPKKELQISRRQDGLYSRTIPEVRTMLHAKSLRVIGQSLEMLRLRAFELEKRGDFYTVRSESLTVAHEWILRNNFAENIPGSAVPDDKSTSPTVGDGCLCYGPLDIARLNAVARNKRGQQSFAEKLKADKLAELLRTLGDHLDSKGATAFTISWTPDSVSVEYQTSNGAADRKEFTVEKLQQLALYSRFRRSHSSASIGSRWEIRRPS